MRSREGAGRVRTGRGIRARRHPWTRLRRSAWGRTRWPCSLDAVVLMPWDAGHRRELPAAPASWYAPALSESAVLWVDRRDSAWTGLDVLRLSPDGRSAQVLVRAPGDQVHVAASEHWVAWVETHFVVVQDLRTGERRRYPSDTHAATGLSLWGPVACWEHWNGQDVDAVCSDGLIADGPGHQRAPSRYQGWMLYRDGERTMVATATELVWDDDDPRAQRTGPTSPKHPRYPVYS